MDVASWHGDVEKIECGTTHGGCVVYAVKRAFGPGAQQRYGSACGAHYWTVVVQTMPGRAKTMAFCGGKRFYGSFDPADDRRAAEASAHMNIEMNAQEHAAMVAIWGADGLTR